MRDVGVCLNSTLRLLDSLNTICPCVVFDTIGIIIEV